MNGAAETKSTPTGQQENYTRSHTTTRYLDVAARWMIFELDGLVPVSASTIVVGAPAMSCRPHGATVAAFTVWYSKAELNCSFWWLACRWRVTRAGVARRHRRCVGHLPHKRLITYLAAHVLRRGSGTAAESRAGTADEPVSLPRLPGG